MRLDAGQRRTAPFCRSHHYQQQSKKRRQADRSRSSAPAFAGDLSLSNGGSVLIYGCISTRPSWLQFQAKPRHLLLAAPTKAIRAVPSMNSDDGSGTGAATGFRWKSSNDRPACPEPLPWMKKEIVGFAKVSVNFP